MKLETLAYAASMSSGLLLSACDRIPEPLQPDLGAAPQHTVITTIVRQDIPPLGGAPVFAQAMNASGQVVGGTEIVGNVQSHAFIWDGTTIQDLGTLGGSYREALAINNLGHVVGRSEDATPEQHAFLWDGAMHDLGPSVRTGGDEFIGDVMAMNDADKVVFSHYFVDLSPTELHPFLWDGARHDLGSLGGRQLTAALAINNNGQIIGNSEGIVAGRAFLWDGTMHDLGTLDGGQSIAKAINDAGQIAGFSSHPSGGFHAVLWSDGVIHDLGTLDGADSYAFDLNNAGQVVGFAQLSSGEEHAVFWDGATVRDLGTLGGRWAIAFSVNDAGQVAGIGSTTSKETHVFFWDGAAMHDLGEGDLPIVLNDAGQVMSRRTRWTISQRPATPTEEIQITQTAVDNLESGGKIAHGHATSLRAKLNAAARQAERGNTNAARNILRAFINEVQNLVSHGSLGASDGQTLIDTAQSAIDKL